MDKRDKIEIALIEVLCGSTPEAVLPSLLNCLSVREQREFEIYMSLPPAEKQTVMSRVYADYEEKLKAETLEILRDIRDKYPGGYNEMIGKGFAGNYYELQNLIINEYIKIIESKLSA